MHWLLVFILLLPGTLAAQTNNAELDRSTVAERIYKETDADKKVKLYRQWLEKYPPEKFANSLAIYDYAKIEIGKAYVREKNIDKAIDYATKIEYDEVKPELWSDFGNILLSNNFEIQAKQFFIKAWEAANLYVYGDRRHPQKIEITSRFSEYSLQLSRLMFILGEIEQALVYIDPAFIFYEGFNNEVNKQYLLMLAANGQHHLAIGIGDDLITYGFFDFELRSILINIVKQNKGLDSAEKYEHKWTAIANKSRKQILAKEIIDVPAPSFTLFDVTGKQVSLSDFKGKTVVLDFWATWCVPCLESFPYLKRVVQSYVEDSLVKFLFIHTWEKANDAPQKARKILDELQLPFQVLMDLKDPVTEVNKVVEDYNIEALPAKVIIDKNGRIRMLKIANWKKETSDGNAMEELMTMIELVKTLAP